MRVGYSEEFNDSGSIQVDAPTLSHKLLLIAWSGYKQRDIQKDHEAKVGRQKDKSMGGWTNRVCLIMDPVFSPKNLPDLFLKLLRLQIIF